MSEPLQLPSRYQPIRQLGEGAFGVVLRCRDSELRRDVAIKILKQEVCDAPMIQRFRREAEASARVRHGNIVAVFDAGVTGDGRPFLVSEYVKGRSLEDKVLVQGGVSAELGLRWVTELKDALEAIHGAGLLHRDVKPANVIVRDDRPLLCDFGLSRFVDSRTRLTDTGMIVGTPVYFAPELMRSEDATPATDLFALGALGYEAVYGELWWQAKNLPDLVGLGASYLEVDRSRFGRSPELDELLMRLLDPDPEVRCGRPAGAGGGVARDLESGMGGSPPPGAAPSLASSSRLRASEARAGAATGAPTPQRRSPGTGQLLGGALVLGLGVGLLSPGAGPSAGPAVTDQPSAASAAPGTPATSSAAAAAREEPAALAAARRALKVGAPRSGPPPAGPFDEVQAVLPAIVDPRTPLQLRRLVRVLNEHAGDATADLGPALATLARATQRFRRARGAATEATLAGLQPTAAGIDDPEFARVAREDLPRANKDIETEAKELMAAEEGGAEEGADVRLVVKLSLLQVHLARESATEAARQTVARLSAASPEMALRMTEGLWRLLDLDQLERVLRPPSLVATLTSLQRELPKTAGRSPARAWAEVAARACAAGAIALRRLGEDAPHEAFAALDSLHAHLESFREEAPAIVLEGLERARDDLTRVGPLRSPPGPKVLAAHARLSSVE